jgi:hypothetical protein
MKIDMKHGFMKSIIKNQVDRYSTYSLINSASLETLIRWLVYGYCLVRTSTNQNVHINARTHVSDM